MSNELKELSATTEFTELDGDATGNLIMNVKQMAMIGKVARTYSQSSIVPASYQGNPANCFVAVELATRMGVSPLLVMQQLYVVQGRPAWSGQACIALVNGCGLFDHFELVLTGEHGADDYGCYAQAVKRSTGSVVRGTLVTMRMAADEGWLQKSGSKWKTMPEQMLKYRAAAFFARTECPNVLMGYMTADEVEDVRGAEPEQKMITHKLSREDNEE